MRIAAASIAVGLAVMGIKYVAYVTTGSVALYSDALESIVNVLAACAAMAAIWIAQKPADDEHPFGHHKAELFSAVLEGVLISIAALLIVREAVLAIAHPRTLSEPLTGLIINGVATAINGGWAVLLISRGKALGSPALTADGWHLMTDVWTSVGVIGGILLAVATGWAILDPVIALIVAANILFAGYRIVTGSLSGLIDEAAPAGMQADIRAAIARAGEGALQAHDIRTRSTPRVTFIEFHLVVPGEMRVADAHAICDRLEAAIEAHIPGSDVVIHVEPDEKVKEPTAATVEIDGCSPTRPRDPRHFRRS
ncbi:MAG: cation diffusion facilitator family transporter [Hyphomicrobiaceae bacterium]|nr:cation diffusion facilitator family transporter [Hyphomicrobiaceae bacterium]